MSTNQQWDVKKALSVASLFHFFYSAGNACVTPFLTLYLRQLGLTPPLVGIIIGLKHLIASLWAPLCSHLAKSHSKKKVLITGSLLCSVGASLLLTLIPPLSKDVVYQYCNASQHPRKPVIVTQGPGVNAAKTSPTTETLTTATNGLAATGKPRFTNVAFQEFASRNVFNPRTEGVAGEETTEAHFSDGPSGVLSPAVTVMGHMLERSAINEQGGSNPASGLGNMEDDREEGLSPGRSTEFSVFQTDPSPFAEAPFVFQNLSGQKAQKMNFQLLQGTDFLDGEHQLFLLVLAAVVFWELLAAPLSWTVDESLYEYLDFVDATDRYGKLWVWSYLGASVGVCGIAIFVDQLSCFLNANILRMAVHFYGYSLLITLALLVSVFFPIHASKKSEHVNKTIKALNLIGSDGRTVLSAVTVFLTGAAGAAAHNFLFWQMQDQGSSELYMGLSVAVGLVAEILLYFFRSKLLSALSSSGTVALGLSCLATQLLYYSFLWNAWSVLPAQVSCAFSNGALWWAVTMLADDVATPGTERSLHSVLQGLSNGCGASLGSFAAGFVVNSFGLAVLYRACSLSLVLWLILFLIVQSKLPRQKKINYSRLLAADPSDASDSDEEKERDWLVKAMKDEKFNRNW
uniref:Major facilitator superfamily domain containing 6 like n=1 Tax=Sphenodon punctatus TaxID=8508 RepID=A0A8D0GEQ8_SPHPU